MKQLRLNHLLYALVPGLLLLTIIAWQTKGHPLAKQQQPKEDTVPAPKKNRSSNERENNPEPKELSQQLQQLDNALKNLDEQMQHIDWQKMNDEVQHSLDKATKELDEKKLDLENIQKTVNESLQKIDFDKIEQETKAALEEAKQNIDFAKIKAEVDQSMVEAKKQLNSPEFQKSLAEAQQINRQEVKKELEKAKIEFEKNKVDLKKELDKAKVDIQKSKEELKGYQQMLGGMENDGLINSKEDYDIEYKENELYINHQKQSATTRDKYQHYFKKDPTHILKKDGIFNITAD
jgi:hypothetical protein